MVAGNLHLLYKSHIQVYVLLILQINADFHYDYIKGKCSINKLTELLLVCYGT